MLQGEDSEGSEHNNVRFCVQADPFCVQPPRTGRVNRGDSGANERLRRRICEEDGGLARTMRGSGTGEPEALNESRWMCGATVSLTDTRRELSSLAGKLAGYAGTVN